MLTSKQAQENQKRYGMNEIREKKKLSIPRVFLEQYKDHSDRICSYIRTSG